MDISQPITDRRKAAAFPIEAVRARFPALAAPDDFVFLDNAAGAQVPAQVLEAVTQPSRRPQRPARRALRPQP